MGVGVGVGVAEGVGVGVWLGPVAGGDCCAWLAIVANTSAQTNARSQAMPDTESDLFFMGRGFLSSKCVLWRMAVSY
jgi:hypothetical protein